MSIDIAWPQVLTTNIAVIYVLRKSVSHNNQIPLVIIHVVIFLKSALESHFQKLDGSRPILVSAERTVYGAIEDFDCLSDKNHIM